MTEYNIYCDESCHLEHDKERVMVIGGIRCPRSARRIIARRIYDVKQEYKIPQYAEIKWNKVSPSNVDYFKALISLFFEIDELEFRAVIVDKAQLKHEAFNQTHDDFYYKIYYYCLSGLLQPKGENYIYLDKKDTRGTYRISKLKEILSNKNQDFDQKIIRRIQCVNSEELPILQIADLLVGAIGYHNREIPNPSDAKCELISTVQSLSGYSLEKSTLLSEKKLNLFFIDLR